MPQHQRKRAIVVLGAGASFDAATGATPANAGWRPPLAKELFNNRPEFWQILQNYERVRFLQSELGVLSKQDALPIEEKFREYSESENDWLRACYAEMPYYLHDLLQSVSADYVPSGSSNYGLSVKRLLIDEPHDVAFVSLNYDSLLEQALEAMAPEFKFQKSGDYVARRAHGQTVMVVKPHGSVNWFYRIPKDHPNEAWSTMIDAVGAQPEIVQHQRSTLFVKRLGGSARAQTEPTAFGDGEDWLYPAVTAPVAGKSPRDGTVCPQDQFRMLLDFASTCTKLLFVGTSGLDRDVLEPLGAALPERAFGYFVGVDDISTAMKQTRKAMNHTVPTRAPSSLYDGGFSSYVQDGAIADFLDG